MNAIRTPTGELHMEHELPVIRREQCVCGGWITAAIDGTQETITRAVQRHNEDDVRHGLWRSMRRDL